MLRIKPCSTGSFTTAKTMRELPENVCDNNIRHRLDQLCTVVLDATAFATDIALIFEIAPSFRRQPRRLT